MKHQLKMGLMSAMILFFSFQVAAQAPAYNQNSSRSNNAKAYNQNEARSNHRRSFSNNEAWDFGINSNASLGVKSNESTLFRGNSLATKLFAHYYMGNAGLGISGGFIPGALSDNALNNFFTERKYQLDQIQAFQSKPFNGYLLAGPSFKFGNHIEIHGDLQGGIFLSNPGALSVTMPGAARPMYRYDAGDKNLFPGFSGNLSVVYPIGRSSSFFINTEYLQSKSSIKIFDPQRGIDIPALQNRNVKLLNFGIGISKSFDNRGGANGKRVLPTVNKREIAIDESGVHINEVVSPRDMASGQSSGKRLLPTVNKREIAIDESGVHRILPLRDIANGQASGKRVLPTVNKREIAIDESGVHFNEIVSPRDMASGQASGKMYQPGRPVYGNREMENCGPVSIKKTLPDGTTEEKTFACTADALAYENMTLLNNGSSADARKPFVIPHVLEKSGIIHRDIASRNILTGRVSWSSGAGNPTGIVTNKTAAVSSVSNLGGGASSAAYAATGRSAFFSGSMGIASNFYAREASSGKATGKRAPRDIASGQATGKRQYEPIFFEGRFSQQ